MTEPVLDGRYRLIAPIARGGMSVVWRGRDDVLARAIAVKVISNELGAGATFTERVRREAMAVARLTHPHIATVYDYGESIDASGKAMPYIVMELVEGESLAQALRRGPMRWPAAVEICAQVASALAAAHHTHVVHRDITPSNVMIAVDGVKVIDFGISAIAGDHADHQILGTPAYLAPERMSGGPALPATDVYGLGLLLYKTLTGRLPWPAATTTQMVAAHRYVPPAPLPPISGLPPFVADLCHRCLAVNPADRPTSDDAFSILAEAVRLGDLGRADLGRADLSGVDLSRAELGRADPPIRTRVLPHGVTELVDPTATTVSIGAAAGRPTRVRRHRVFVLPAVLLVVLFGCLGLARLHPSGGSLAAPRPSTMPLPTSTAPAGPPHVAEAPAAPRPMACRVDYRIMSVWSSGYTAQVTIANTGGVPVSGWTLRFRLPAHQRLGGGWDGLWHQDGHTVTVHDAVYNRDLAAGSSITLGFVGSTKKVHDGHPSHFTLNGHPCTAG